MDSLVQLAGIKKNFGDANALGQRISFGPGPYRPAEDYEIIGVLQNAKYANVRSEVPRTAYMPFTAMPSALGSLSFQIEVPAKGQSEMHAARGLSFCPGCGKWETYSPRRTETPDGYA